MKNTRGESFGCFGFDMSNLGFIMMIGFHKP